jgi:predicted nucleotide-binding protein
MASTIFIGSSSAPAANQVADGVFRYFNNEGFHPRHWRDIFAPGEVAIDTLLDQASQCDFAILIMTGDDRVLIDDAEHIAVRDNILFELGLFDECDWAPPDIYDGRDRVPDKNSE